MAPKGEAGSPQKSKPVEQELWRLIVRREIIVFLMGVVVCIGIVAEAGKYSGGSGTLQSPYRIADANDLILLSDSVIDWDNHFIMVTDVNMLDYIFPTALIAPDTSTDHDFQGHSFEGSFDGNGHKILNLTIECNGNDNDFLGLFGLIDSGSQVTNLCLENVSINGGDYSWNVGGLCGRVNSGTIDNCYTIHSIKGYINVGGLCGENYEGIINNCNSIGYIWGHSDSGEDIGGLCGRNFYGTISKCFAINTITGYSNLGGLCGENIHGIINYCSATGDIFGDYNVGGLCSINGYGTIINCFADVYIEVEIGSGGGLCAYSYQSKISHCYALGSVKGELRIGGLCGFNYEGTINHSYAIGFVIGDQYVGGLCGNNYQGLIYQSFWDVQTSGISSSAGGVGKTTAEMIANNTYSGWGDAIWTIDNDKDYPHLIWEEKTGIPIIDSPRSYSGGNGTLEYPYFIAEPDDLIKLGLYSADCDKHFRLTKDIDMSTLVFNTCIIPEFGGVFEGNNFAISNITFDSINDNGNTNINECYMGLFGRINSEESKLENLSLNNISIVSGDESAFLGSLCGKNNGNIINCHAVSSISGGKHMGGLCGWNNNTIRDCYSTSIVTGNNRLSCLCGTNYYGTITNCYATGEVYGDSALGILCGGNSVGGTIKNSNASGFITGGHSSALIGGLCGSNSHYLINCYATVIVTGGDHCERIGGLSGDNSNLIYNCYSTGSVTGGYSCDYLGGLCGNSGGDIYYCYSTGLVSGGTSSDNVGGFCGYVNGTSTEIANSFWNTETSNLNIGYNINPKFPSTITNVLGLTTAEMQTQSSFTDYGWDFVGEDVNGTNDIWRMCVDGVDYPRLSWEYSINGDFACPDGVDLIDFSFLSKNWLTEGLESFEQPDLTGDGIINIDDIIILAERWVY